MSGVRNVLLTVGVTGLLIFGLFVLFPGASVGAVKVESISPGTLQAGTDGTSGTADDYLDVVVTVSIPEGEFAPLSEAAVIIDATPLSGDNIATTNGAYGQQLDTQTCVAATGGAFAGFTSSGGASLSIRSVAGATLETNVERTGYGYSIGAVTLPGGYGYTGFQNTNEVAFNGGYGYGYGSASADQTATVTLRIDGCAGLLNPHFVGGVGSFAIQGFIGEGAIVFPSAPSLAELVIDQGTPSNPTNDANQVSVSTTSTRPKTSQVETTARLTAGTGDGIGSGVTKSVNMPPCLLYTSPSPRDQRGSRMPSSA